MITIQKTIDIPADRRLTLDLPKNIPSGRVNVCMVFDTSTETAASLTEAEPPAAETPPRGDDAPALYPLDRREAINAIAWNYGKQNDSSRVYAGCLKGKGVFKGDPVAIQRKMRDEWQDARS
jgi:hypothetical protein